MSQFETECTQHDIYVSLAIESFTNEFNGVLLYSDGRLPFRDHITEPCPVFHGYRPDAVMINPLNQLWFIEVKSYGDMYSIHSKSQYEIIKRLILERKNLYLFLFVFDSEEFNVSFPTELDQDGIRERIIIAYPEVIV